MIRTLVTLAAAAALCLCAEAAGAAGANRVWVSGRGVDKAGCGAPTGPCRSLQYAHDNAVAAGGEIDILDPAGYGAIAITKSISIVNDGVGTAGVQQAAAGQDAVSIAAGAGDAVTLRGLTIDGLGVAQDGVGVSSAGRVTIANCVIRHFVHDGVYAQPAADMSLSAFETTASDNGVNGFDMSPQSNSRLRGFIDHAYAFNNGANGVSVYGANANSGGVVITVSNSNISNNRGDGLYVFTTQLLGGNTVANVVNVTSDFNQVGYEADGTSFLQIARSEALFEIANSVVIHASAGGTSSQDNVEGPALVSGSLAAMNRF